MKAVIITIGDEILIGQIVDTNSSYIAKSLDKIGIQTYEMISISDEKEHILNTLKKYQNTADIVVITGGLGPTKDDITKKTFCEYFNDHLVINQEVLAHVTLLVEQFFKRPINQINKDQALVPSTSKVLFNKMGTAPGMWMQKEKTTYISLPGVPYEMKYLIDEVVIPALIAEFKRPYIIHKTILTYGQGESLIAERIEQWENQLPSFVKLAYLPSPGRVRLRLTARGNDKETLENAITKNVLALEKIIPDIIVGYDDSETIEVIVGQKLIQLNQTIATAESCTGGKIASTITSIAGSSAYFKGSIVAYGTDIKENILHINQQIIENHSVVSAPVAKAMAENVKKMCKTHYAIATTGNAGPQKGDSNAEVGTVFIALATPTQTIVEEFNFGQPREKVIDRTVNKALEMLLKEISKNN